MKSFGVTVWGVILFFSVVMLVVAIISFKRDSNATGHDPAQINRLREIARKTEGP